MKLPKITISACVTFLIVILTGINSHAQDFEGVIYYQIAISSTPQASEIAYMIKEKQVRMEMGIAPNKVAIIYRPKKDETFALFNRMKAYMKIDEESLGLDNKKAHQPKEPKIEQTGTTKTIAGYSCEIWYVETDQGKRFKMCMNKELGEFVAPQNPMSNRQGPIWVQITETGPAFPLEVKTTGDEEQVLLRATKIEEKPLDTSLFEIPESYSDLSGQMKQ